MIVILKKGTTDAEMQDFIRQWEQRGYGVHISRGEETTILGLVGDTTKLNMESFIANPIVEDVKRVTAPYKMAGRAFHPDNTVIAVGTGGDAVSFGGDTVPVIAGPCSVESEEQVVAIAKEVKKAGAKLLRGGAFKPRTSPYAFQGLGAQGLEFLKSAKKETGLPIVTELMDVRQLQYFADVDIIQIGARNMQNFDLLKEMGKAGKPILLKRGMAATVKELLMSAEYIMASGNENVILCERGVRTFDSYTRNCLDVSVVPYLHKVSHLPVIIDPSHACGMSWMVPTLAKAAVAAGADGLIIEVHNDPSRALCDGEQSLHPDEFASLMETLKKYAQAEGRTI
ncbi:phospho-2-dehydro-3-deoxyheptonate aldolase [Treponema maltophilum ATCC 51939]|uniref:Phospho-2-dehydro-3-deoxyheptonate aldolase n=1 Tax=Treponema maltophilum ATCC 51939 TaxID=1125699 RepID=S3JYG4_TREMA|nr:3-deoxy-7-phosphoheptulonate synthase [Treponema maltophilum]EPF30260.1 phospho-2-dehydro-3-deoxyheptonate aldolase [Treponema maltophilum ATCC 51939]